jgi:ligand-binding sensor domain-containing protein
LRIGLYRPGRPGPGATRARPKRFLEVSEVNSKPLLVLTAIAMALTVQACEETVVPPGPEKARQISTVTSYMRSGTGIPDNDVYAITVTSENEVWMGTPVGIAIFPSINATTRTGDIVNELNGLPGRQVRAIEEYNNRIYVATWGGGVGVYDMTSDTWLPALNQAKGLRDNYVAAAAASPTEDRVYFATNNGVSIYNATAGTFSSFIPPTLLDKIVSAVAIKDNGTVERWYGPRFEPFMTPDQEPAHGITVSRGPSTVIQYTLSNSGIAEARVNDIFYDADDDVFYVGFASSGIAKVDANASTWTYHTTVNGLPSNEVYSITKVDGVLWAGTQRGIARLKSDGTWQGYARSGGLQADRARVVYSDDGSRLWVGFIEGGAARVNPGSAQ